MVGSTGHSYASGVAEGGSEMATEVYGASDDLIEFEGDVSGEVDCYDQNTQVMFSDGTFMTWHYGKKLPGTERESGVWSVEVTTKGTLFDRVEECFDEDAKCYSDTAHFRDGLKWAKERKVSGLQEWRLVE